MPDGEQPGGQPGKRQRQDSGLAQPALPVQPDLRPPDAQKINFATDDLPEDYLNTADEVKKRFSLRSRKPGSPKETEEQQKAREDQRFIWDGLVLRMDHTDKQNTKNFDAITEHLQKLTTYHEERDKTLATEKHLMTNTFELKIINSQNQMQDNHNKLEAGLSHMSANLNTAVLSMNAAAAQWSASANGANVQSPVQPPSANAQPSSAQYPGGNNSLFVRGSRRR